MLPDSSAAVIELWPGYMRCWDVGSVIWKYVVLLQA
jgi:hypothetical protein